MEKTKCYLLYQMDQSLFLQIILIIQSVSYIILKCFPIVVVDAHLQSVSAMFWEEDKKVLITCSEDKTIKMCQFPVYWPGEMIREKQSTKRNSNFSGSIFGINNNQDNTVFSNTKNDNNNSFYVKPEIKERSKARPLDDSEIWSEDVDGWSTE